LLDSGKKAAYDGELRRRFGAPRPGQPAVPAAVVARPHLPVATPIPEAAPLFAVDDRPRSVRKSRGSRTDDAWVIARFQAESPAHQVTITRPYLMGETEVTVGQYRRFVEATGYVTETEKFGGGDSSSKEETDAQKKTVTWRATGDEASENTAVGEVTWADAVEFCNWLSTSEQKTPCYRRDDKDEWTLSPEGNGYRLPTEAEWEYACRAGTATQFSFSDDLAVFNQYGWSNKIGPVPQARAVAAKRPNPFGLFDMHGNVEEWCFDGFNATYYASSPAVDPTGPTFIVSVR
jgi:formylglycine-generating enzyme required for sulfatase activity